MEQYRAAARGLVIACFPWICVLTANIGHFLSEGVSDVFLPDAWAIKAEEWPAGFTWHFYPEWTWLASVVWINVLFIRISYRRGKLLCLKIVLQAPQDNQHVEEPQP